MTWTIGILVISMPTNTIRSITQRASREAAPVTALSNMNIVGIGGGTGLSGLLSGLREVSCGANGAGSSNMRISAIVGVADTGGSSRLLRESMGIPAVGGLRRCL